MKKENRYIVLYKARHKTEYKALTHLYYSERLAIARAELLIEERRAVKTKIITIEGVME